MSTLIEGKKNRVLFLFMGILATGLGVYLNFESIVNKKFPNSIIILVMGLNFLMMAYLSPHLFPRDERAKSIIGKAMTINYFVLYSSFIVLFLLTSSVSSALLLNAEQVILVLFSIMSLSIPGTMVIYSKLI